MEPVMVLVLTLLISIVSVVVVLVVLFAAGSFGSRQLTPRPEVRALPMSEPTLFRIRQLLGERRKIQAIKELRDSQPGLGLKEAKELVEAIEAGHEPPVLGPGPNPQPAAGPSSDLAERVRQLRDSGQETLAIRLVCDETGMGIIDAQTFVRSLS